MKLAEMLQALIRFCTAWLTDQIPPLIAPCEQSDLITGIVKNADRAGAENLVFWDRSCGDPLQNKTNLAKKGVSWGVSVGVTS
jgi:hypothetical protein